MSVYKQKGSKNYWFHFIWNGQHLQRSTKQRNKRVAETIEDAFRTKLAKGEVDILDAQAIPGFSHAMKEFLLWSEQEHKAHPRTFERYAVSSRPLLRFFGDRKLNHITPDLVEEYKLQRSKQYKIPRKKKSRNKKLLRPATVNRELACLKAMFNYHIKANDRLRNPVCEVKYLDEDNEQLRILTYAEQAVYLAACSELLKDVATILVETGMRPEEVYRMQIGNVSVAGAWYFNPYGKTKAAKRKVPLNKVALEVVIRRMSEAKGLYLFPSPKDPNKPVLKLNNAHYGALKRSKLPHFRLYDLRHTWATRAAEAGIDLVTLAAMLGHSKINMVTRYAHPTEQHQAVSAKRLEEYNVARAIAEQELTSTMVS
jgi:integrase